MPESPRWLLKMGRNDEARTVLGLLRSETGDPEAENAKAEYDDIVAAIALEQENSKRNSYISMFFGLHDDGNLHIARRVHLSIWLQIIQEYVLRLEVQLRKRLTGMLQMGRHCRDYCLRSNDFR